MSRAVAGELTVRRITGLSIIAVLVGLAFMLGPGALPAAAHAQLLGSDPQDRAVLDTAPASAELRFNENVQLIDGAIRLFPSDGDPVVLQAQVADNTVKIKVPSDLGNGGYALSYRLVSADGHPLSGVITFQIGQNVTAAPDLSSLGQTPTSTEFAVSAATFLQYLGLLVFAGTIFFETLIRRSAGRAAGIRRLLAWSLGTAGVASLLLIPLSALRIVGKHPFDLAPVSSWAREVQWQSVAVAAVVVMAGGAGVLLSRRWSHRVWRSTTVVLAVLAVSSPLLVGHTETVRPRWLMVGADLGHLLAGAYWLGGVLGLMRMMATTRPGEHGGPPRSDPAPAAVVVARFSRYAVVSVVLLTVSGVLMGWRILQSWDALFTTSYGHQLLLKLSIVVAVLGLAIWNRAWLLPRIAERDQARDQWITLRRTVSYESALLVSVLVITAFLTNSSPSHEHAPTAQTSDVQALHAESQGLTVDGTMRPGSAGTNDVVLRLVYRGDAVTTDDVTVEARLPAQELGPFSVTPTRDTASGEYHATLSLPVPGEWTLQVSVGVDQFTQPLAVLPVTVS